VIVPVVDGRLVALDAQTGKLMWSAWARYHEAENGDQLPASRWLRAL
jgi:glucose dehydrogenase